MGLKLSGSYWAGDFARFLRRLNPKLRCIRGATEDRAGWASVYVFGAPDFDADGCPWHQVCGVPVGWLPERTIYQPDGKHIWKRGWREVLFLVSQKGLISLPRQLTRDGGLLAHGRMHRFSSEGCLVPA